MKRSGWTRTILAVAFAGATFTNAQAQRARPAVPAAPGPAARAPEGMTLKLKHLPRLGRATLQRTPDYNATGSRAARQPREWAVIDVPFVTAPEWMDEIAFTFHVMSERVGPDGKKEYSLYETTVRYIDVARGEHLASVVLPPGAVLRYGEPKALAVDVAGADGAPLAADAKSDIASLPADWWKNPKVTDNASVVKRQGCLVDRTKTPFANLNFDDYEMVK